MPFHTKHYSCFKNQQSREIALSSMINFKLVYWDKFKCWMLIYNKCFNQQLFKRIYFATSTECIQEPLWQDPVLSSHNYFPLLPITYCEETVSQTCHAFHLCSSAHAVPLSFPLLFKFHPFFKGLLRTYCQGLSESHSPLSHVQKLVFPSAVLPQNFILTYFKVFTIVFLLIWLSLNCKLPEGRDFVFLGFF